MTKPKGGPKKAEHEPTHVEQAIAYFVEECGEALAAAGKSLRWGLMSFNPELPTFAREHNVTWLLREIADVDAAIQRVRFHAATFAVRAKRELRRWRRKAPTPSRARRARGKS